MFVHLHAPNFSNPILGTCAQVEVSLLIASSIKNYYGFVSLLFVFLMCVCVCVCLFVCLFVQWKYCRTTAL